METSPIAKYSTTNHCYYCGCFVVHHERQNGQTIPANHKTFDHLTPRMRGGPNTPANKVIACARCNSEKGQLTEAEYRTILAYRKGPLALLAVVAREQAKNMRMYVAAAAVALLLINWRLRIWY